MISPLQYILDKITEYFYNNVEEKVTPAQVKEVSDMLANSYLHKEEDREFIKLVSYRSSGVDYKAGESAIYQKQLYQAVTDIADPAGPFDPAKWQLISEPSAVIKPYVTNTFYKKDQPALYRGFIITCQEEDWYSSDIAAEIFDKKWEVVWHSEVLSIAAAATFLVIDFKAMPFQRAKTVLNAGKALKLINYINDSVFELFVQKSVLADIVLTPEAGFTFIRLNNGEASASSILLEGELNSYFHVRIHCLDAVAKKFLFEIGSTKILVNDTDYGASWQSDNEAAASRRAVYEKIEEISSAISGQGESYEVLSVSTPGQSSFSLGTNPSNYLKTKVFLNGVCMKYTVDYTFSTNTLVWTSIISLSPTDDLKIYIS